MKKLPSSFKITDALTWDWDAYAPLYQDLERSPIDAQTIDAWLRDWSTLAALGDEVYNRLYVATSVDTSDATAQQRFNHFMDAVKPNLAQAEARLQKKLLACPAVPPEMAIPLQKVRIKSSLFCEKNVELLGQIEKMNIRHDDILGKQTVSWDGQEKTIQQLSVVLKDRDREHRRKAWEAINDRQLQDRSKINEMWTQYFSLRETIAHNAGEADYCAYRWKELLRLDYAPRDCKEFAHSIEEMVVPLLTELSELRKDRLGICRLYAYDLEVSLEDEQPLQPFYSIPELVSGAASILKNIHPRFAEYLRQMNAQGLLDLESRANKANGGYCAHFVYTKMPFIFANAVGTHRDVQTLLHESGHAFNDIESAHLPYLQQRHEDFLPMEFAETASMGMEYLCLDFMTQEYGGFYTPQEAARAKIEQFESDLFFLPYMAMVDAFQHWAYSHPGLAMQPDQCDRCWSQLEDRFRPYLCWDGYEEFKQIGWQKKDHIFQVPFYYIEYGMAWLGSLQLWQDAREDRAGTIRAYRHALSLGASVSLPALFKAAGIQFAFDKQTLGLLVNAVRSELIRLRASF